MSKFYIMYYIHKYINSNTTDLLKDLKNVNVVLSQGGGRDIVLRSAQHIIYCAATVRTLISDFRHRPMSRSPAYGTAYIIRPDRVAHQSHN